METQKQETTQEYSDIKVSKETAKVLDALAAWENLFEKINAIDGLVVDVEDNIIDQAYKLEGALQWYLREAVEEQQNKIGYTYRVI